MEPGFNYSNATPQLLEQYKDYIVSNMTKTIDNIVQVQNNSRTFGNTIQPLINTEITLEPYEHYFSFAMNFHPDKEVRDKATELEKVLDEFYIEIGLRKDLYQAQLSYYNSQNYQNDKNNLTDEEIRYLEHSIRDSRRNGLDLNENDYQLVKAKSKEIANMQTDFSKNLNDENTFFEFSQEELDGMPEHWFCDEKIIRKDDKTTYYKVTLKYPDVVPAMEYVKSEEVRKKLLIANQSKCGKENTELLGKTIKLKYEIARLLGYKTHADYKTEVKVIKSSKKANEFENEMNQKSDAIYKQNVKDLLYFAKNQSSNPIKKQKLDKWDRSYYIREYTEMKHNINMEELRQYFPLQVVKEGLFKIYQGILNLNFTKVDTTNKWHDDVELYRVQDKNSNEVMGYFYLDLHPREGKYSHAAVFEFITGCDLFILTGDLKRRPHVMGMACNFPRDGNIDYDDVVTFFHEFGHVMHQVCSKSQLTDFASFNVEWDFVEAHSQMFERWCRAEKALKLMSQNLPDDIIPKIKSKENCMNGFDFKGQLLIGMFDLHIHSLTNFDNLDLQKIWSDLETKLFHEKPTHQLPRFASIGHYMGGYDAGYYGYMFSDVYASNMFFKMFGEDNVLEEENGMRYRKRMLEPGSSKDSMDMLVDFLDGEPDSDYFLVEKGLKKARKM